MNPGFASKKPFDMHPNLNVWPQKHVLFIPNTIYIFSIPFANCNKLWIQDSDPIDPEHIVCASLNLHSTIMNSICIDNLHTTNYFCVSFQPLDLQMPDPKYLHFFQLESFHITMMLHVHKTLMVFKILFKTFNYDNDNEFLKR